ncbi:MAG: valine--tRNA ligase, partial [Gammaproteobacteria bacterium]|nr:valine--tRNA ligase [Gammaproteobacteria bacterium]
YLVTVGRVESVEWLEPDQSAPESATALVGNMKLLIPLSGLIDKEAEIIRLARELDKKASELDRCEKKLSNGSFVDKAPAAVVEKERLRADDLKSAISNLEEQQQRIQSL